MRRACLDLEFSERLRFCHSGFKEVAGLILQEECDKVNRAVPWVDSHKPLDG